MQRKLKKKITPMKIEPYYNKGKQNKTESQSPCGCRAGLILDFFLLFLNGCWEASDVGECLLPSALLDLRRRK